MRDDLSQTLGGSLVLGSSPKGCEYCMKGSKIVVFMTGRCFAKCYYCPLSDIRKNSDTVYVNEVKAESDQIIIREAALIEAEGAGLTGGDPLLTFDKTLKYIKLLKDNFGSKFHIHLYTTGYNLNRERASALIRNGLDEIRFHPIGDVTDKIKLFQGTEIKFGCEIPAIPGDERRVENLVKFLERAGADFININELEFSETNASELKKRGLKLKKDSIAAVEGSEETALRILEWCRENTEEISVHYCPSWIKDGVQLRNRFLRRARNVRKPYEEIDGEGLLVRGVAYLDEMHNIEEVRNMLVKEYEVPEDMFEIDYFKKQVYTAWYIVEELAGELAKINIKSGIVKSHPTDDRFIVMSYYL